LLQVEGTAGPQPLVGHTIQATRQESTRATATLEHREGTLPAVTTMRVLRFPLIAGRPFGVFDAQRRVLLMASAAAAWTSNAEYLAASSSLAGGPPDPAQDDIEQANGMIWRDRPIEPLGD
jgi:hypothetical protein